MPLIPIMWEILEKSQPGTNKKKTFKNVFAENLPNIVYIPKPYLISIGLVLEYIPVPAYPACSAEEKYV